MKPVGEDFMNAKQAAQALGVGACYITAIKKAMGIESRYFFLTDLKKYLRKHPEFKVTIYYPRHRPRPASPGEAPKAPDLNPNDLEAEELQPMEQKDEPSMNATKDEAERSNSNPDSIGRMKNHLLAEEMVKLRGDMSQSKFANSVDLAVRTIAEMERPDCTPPTIRTLQKIRQKRRLREDEWIALLAAWLLQKAPLEDRGKLDIRNATAPGGAVKVSKEESGLLALYRGLTSGHRRILQSLLHDSNFLECLPALAKLRNQNGAV